MNVLFIKFGIGFIIALLSFFSFLKTKAKLGIWLLIIILPVYSIKFLGEAGDIFTIEFSDILLAAIVFPLVLREILLSKKNGKTISSKIVGLFFIFIIYFLLASLTIFWTKDSFLTLREIFIIAVFGFLFFTPLITVSRWNEKDLQLSLFLVILTGTMIALLGICQVFFPEYAIIRSVQPGFPTGTFTETNWYVNLLILTGCWSLFALKSQRKSLIILSAVSLPLFLIGIYLAKSMTGLIGFIYLFLLFFIYFLTKRPLVCTFFIFIFLISILIFPSYFAGFVEPFREISAFFQGEISENMEIRSIQLMTSLQLIKNNLWGYGAGTWEPVMKEVTEWELGPFGWINGILLEQGILAFLAWLIFIISCVIIIIKSYILTQRWEIKAALFSFIWILIAGFPHPMYYMNFFWFYMGFSVAAIFPILKNYFQNKHETKTNL